jgi:hypothetical protein
MRSTRILVPLACLVLVAACDGGTLVSEEPEPSPPSGSSTTTRSSTTTTTRSSTASTTTTPTTAPPGTPGPPGPAGPPGVSGYEIRSHATNVNVTDAGKRTIEAVAECPAGKRAISGGAAVRFTPDEPYTYYGFVQESAPINNGAAWRASGSWDYHNGGPTHSFTVTATVICAVVT